MAIAGLEPIVEGWAKHQAMVIEALRDLTPEQLESRTAPFQWAIWQLAAHIAGTRAYWFHDVLGEGDPAIRDVFRVDHVTAADVPLEDAWWEDDEDHPRTATQLVDALTRTWSLVDECLQRWTAEDMAGTVVRPNRAHHRGWVVWHVLEHDVHHSGEISQILGSNGVPGFDM